MMLKKIFMVCILLSLILPSTSIAQNSSGEIVLLEDGEYQIVYNNQITNVYFNIRPSGDLGMGLTGLVLSDQQRSKIVEEIRDFLDELPQQVRGRFLGIDIFALHILAKMKVGMYAHNNIVLEIEPSKLSSMENGNIINHLGHELGHHIYTRLDRQSSTIEIMEWLRVFRKKNPVEYFNNQTSFHQHGYIDRYTYDSFQCVYEVEEEYAELMGLFLRQDNLLKEYMENPSSKLGNKLRQFNAYLRIVEPSLAYASSELVLADITLNPSFDEKADVEESLYLIVPEPESVTTDFQSEDTQGLQITDQSYNYKTTDQIATPIPAISQDYSKTAEKAKNRKSKNKSQREEIVGAILALGLAFLVQ